MEIKCSMDSRAQSVAILLSLAIVFTASAAVSGIIPGVQGQTSAKVLEFKKSHQIWPKNDNTRIAAFADLNGDSYPDCVFASMDSPSLVLFNDGRGQFVDAGQSFPSRMHGIAIGDLDKDGDLDLFFAPIGRGTKEYAIYFNSGKGKFDKSDMLVNGNEDVRLVDIDSDGSLDAYLLIEGVFLNDGKGNFGKKGPLAFQPYSFGDFNKDGYVDAIGEKRLPETNGYAIVVYLNDRRGNFYEYSSTPVGDSQIRLSYGGLADISGDGYVDVVFIRDKKRAPSGLLINDRTGKLTESSQELPSVEEPSWGSIGTGDLDGDGSIDIVITDKDNPAQVWLNDGKGRFTDSGIRLATEKGNTWANCVLKDLDNDGDIDVFIANRISGNHGLWFNQVMENKRGNSLRR